MNLHTNDPITKLTRREIIRSSTMGIGAIALLDLLKSEGHALEPKSIVKQAKRIVPRAKNVIFMHMVGAPSHLDLLDPKPKLRELEGKPIPKSFIGNTRFSFIPEDAAIMASPYSFKKYGKAGTPISELMPHLSTIADDITVINSMHTEEINHGAAELFLHTGFGRLGRPPFGAWSSYGLGSANKNLPSFIVLADKKPVNGSSLWGSGFLPPVHQGIEFKSKGDAVHFLSNPKGMKRKDRRDVVDSVNAINQKQYDLVGDPEIATRIDQYEMAYRMQSSVPDLMQIKNEPQSIFNLYGLDSKNPNAPSFARNCLLARRLVERGVGFVQIFNGGWDHHSNIFQSLPKKCKEIDKACAALIKDLKQRGLLDETLVIWAGEFGRTPMVQELTAQGKRDKPGRDHHKDAFSIWMAGGGVKAGHRYGGTDELGYKAIKNPMSVHDFHATALHLLGVDHKRLTHRYQGRNFRLTDVHGKIVHDIIA